MAVTTENMLWQHRTLMADEVARDFAATVQSFSDTFLHYVAKTSGGPADAIPESRLLECCALIWAAIEATFVSSALTEGERTKVIPLIRDELVQAWRRVRADGHDFVSRVRERSAAYLRHQDPASQLKTATAFMNELGATLDAGAVNPLPVRTLTALLAHQMLSDVRRLNTLKSSGYSIS